MVRHAAQALRASFRFTRDIHLAEDLAQDALLRLASIGRLGPVHSEREVALWIRLKVAQLAPSRVRQWRSEIYLDEKAARRLVGERPVGRHEITRSHLAELYETVKTAIRKRFRPMAWRAFEAVYENDRDPREAALDLGISRNAVYIYGCRILATMREEAARFLE